MDRPLLLFSEPEKSDRNKAHSFATQIHKPTIQRQYSRLMPMFTHLHEAFNRKAIQIQQNMLGVNPEYALVFEVIGNVQKFYKAVQKVEGMEWIFDSDTNDIEQDEDFYIDDSDKKLNGRVYCIMSNQSAISQLLSMWKKYSEDEKYTFPRGLAPLKEVFSLLKNIRIWGAEDRVYETHILEYWRESLAIDGNENVNFEIELFFRKNEQKRKQIEDELKTLIEVMGGKILNKISINEILYHAVLVSLPRNQIENLVLNYENIKLANVDEIMFFRPMCQSTFVNESADIICDEIVQEIEFEGENNPIIALLDGFPMQNHKLLKDRLIIDDPDEYERCYLVKDRIHGTSMASLIIYGDLNRKEKGLTRKIYVRPILKPVNFGERKTREVIPDNVLIVDLLHRSIKRMFEGDNGEPPVAPTVKIINLSIGDPVRQLGTILSPLARLLDWLSFKYNILFIISAGNQNKIESMQEEFGKFKESTIEQRSKEVYEFIQKNKQDFKVLSPAESINNITIGATYDDFCDNNEDERQAFAVSNGLPSPISSFGLGYNKTITPDLFYYGGRKKFVEDLTHKKMKFINNLREPGCKSAAPYLDGTSDGCAYSWGTSDATAQITHEAGKCYEVLKNVFEQDGVTFPKEYTAVMIKAMLIHGATWDGIKDILSQYVDESCKKLARWIGNGIPNISKVEQCARNRVTLIGFGELIVDEAHVYKLPLPFNFSSKRMKKRLTVTLAYMTPTNSSKQSYRESQLWYEVENLDKLSMERQNSDWQMVRKGTVQHEIFESESAVVWDENNELKIKINCKEDADKVKEKVKYALFVTFEVAPEENLEVYEKVKNQIRNTIRINN